jgi:cob(I)alamin adenosyltransferase
LPRITRVYTRTGDDGTTGLGDGSRVAKDDLRIETYGTVDELNACLGVAVSLGLDERLGAELARIQNELFNVGSDLCFPESAKDGRALPTVEGRHVEALERLMDELNLELEPLANFVLPGGSRLAAQLHVARTVCRRAERCAVALAAREAVGPFVVRYLNRLSDTLFVMARWANRQMGGADVLWNSRA